MTDRLTRRRMLALSSVAAGGAVLGSGPIAAQASHESYDETIESHDGTDIATTVYRPAGASADEPVPMILHSHGWSGSRTSGEGSFQRELDRGFGVLSFDQRGHGESGGQAHVQNPELEGRDVIAVLDYVEALEWVARDVGRSGSTSDGAASDPTVFAIGGSYGGAYQFVGALTEIARRGSTRFDALAPQITWHDLSQSLAPQGVVRTAWIAALYALGAGNVPEHIHRGFVYGLTTGQWPNGDTPGEPDLDNRFARNGPSGFVDDGVHLDVPVLMGQGISDNLFNLNQAWRNFEETLTDEARERSAVVGYNGGHALPNLLPAGGTWNFQDACTSGGSDGIAGGDVISSAGFEELRLRFFESVCDGEGDARDIVGSPYSLTTADGERCLQLDVLDDRTSLAAGVDLSVRNDGAGNLELQRADGVDDSAVANPDEFPAAFDPDAVAEAFEGTGFESDVEGGTAGTTTGVGAPVHLELAAGPLTVGGVPELSAAVTSVGVDQRVFFALSVGETPATARVVQNNMLPLREPEPVVGADRTVELPGVAVDVAEGETLYLTLSAISDMSFAHGSIRTPGAVLLEDLTVDVPLVDE
ncbi:alpha/beta fold hydrolase [Natronomonas salina]|uniref:alpha/beta hydrolase family protein n=1 Tax=Natronomonas salina TaxID=1710540 RepID=UPI0015B5200C|nr:alpha/beta fold hydrolase [Natronomonas salina]QLD88176.1 alpha/beta fold hydrolase [Natronomonas salina]